MNTIKFKSSRALYLLLSLFLMLSLTNCTTKTDVSNNDFELNDVTVEFKYFDMITGNEKTYEKYFESATLKDIINDWIGEMNQMCVGYAVSDDSSDIFQSLKLNNVMITDETATLDFNSAFLDFDKAESQTGYFLIGLNSILKQATKVKSYSITIDGSSGRNLIHPDGILIKDVELIRD